MTLVLEIAAGYVLGRLVAHLLALVWTVVIKMVLKRNPAYRRLVAKSLAEDERIKQQILTRAQQ